MVTERDLKQFSETYQQLLAQIRRDMVGQQEIIENAIIAMIAGGNILLEGVPGVGKTRLVRSLGRVFDLPFSRIQFTPDLMPADVTGTNIIERDAQGNARYRFQPGPIFSSIVLADEINRATPKTQSALLEAMQEHMVSIAGENHTLAEPFFVLATQNPIEQEGTYPLPEAQIDRFMFKLLVPYPSVDELRQIVTMTQKTQEETAERVLDADGLMAMRETAREIPAIDEVIDYTMRLVAATHPQSDCPSETARRYIRMGSSPRGAQALITAGKVRALIHGRYNVSFQDIQTLAYPILRHRIKLNFDAISERKTADDLIASMLDEMGRQTKGLFKRR